MKEGINKLNATEYQKYIASLIEGSDKASEFDAPKEDSCELMKNATDSYTRDMAKTDPVADFASTPQSANIIDHRPEAKIYSKEHTLPDECHDKGTKVRGMTNTAVTDDVSGKGKSKQLSDEDFVYEE
jgi:hypothetical protein